MRPIPFIPIYALLLISCASAPEKVTDTVRERAYVFDGRVSGAQGAQAVYVPKGAYIVGKQADLKPGTWVRLLPGDSWKSEELRPTLLAARIAQSQKQASRLEILAVQSGIRETAPHLEVYKTDAKSPVALHAMTKRLTFPLDTAAVQGDVIATPLGSYDLIEGNEIYAACEVSDNAKRLASQCTALMTVDESSLNSDEIRLKKAVGQMPKNPAFVLMDAPANPAYHLRIVYDGESGQEFVQQVNSWLNPRLPGAQFIQVESRNSSLSVEKQVAELGHAESDVLEIRVISGRDGIQVIDQGLRVNDAPWFIVSDGSRATAAAIAAIRALDMLGYEASAAFIGEQVYGQFDSPAQRAAIAPALAYAYHVMERDDWSLEIGLELNGYAQKASKSSKPKILTAAAAVMTIAGLSEEFGTIYDMAQQNKGKLPGDWRKLLAYALGLARDKPDAYASLMRNLIKDGLWNEFDDMRMCTAAMDLGDNPAFLQSCEHGGEHAQTELGKTWFEALPLLHGEDISEILSIANKLDMLGAPNLAMKYWSELSLNHLTEDQAMISAYLNAAAYARTSQQIRVYLSMMAEIVRYSALRHISLDTEVFAEALRGWRALDMRAPLAAYCVTRAMQVTGDESLSLLNFAEELYLSIGDAENLASVRQKRSELGNVHETQ